MERTATGASKRGSRSSGTLLSRAHQVPWYSNDSTINQPTKRSRIDDQIPPDSPDTSIIEEDYFDGSTIVWKESDSDFAARMDKEAQEATREGQKWLAAKVKDWNQQWKGVEFGFASSPEVRLATFREKVYSLYSKSGSPPNPGGLRRFTCDDLAIIDEASEEMITEYVKQKCDVELDPEPDVDAAEDRNTEQTCDVELEPKPHVEGDTVPTSAGVQTHHRRVFQPLILPALPPQQSDEVDRFFELSFTSTGAQTVRDTPLRHADLQRLLPGSWLNDEVVNGYLALIRTIAPRDTLIMDSYFYHLIDSAPQQDYSRAVAFTGRSNIFDYKTLVFPMHVNKEHWVTGAVNLDKSSILILDSLSEASENAVHIWAKKIRGWMTAYCQASGHSDISLVLCRCTATVPQQSNSDDCGVFAVSLIEHIARDMKTFNFGQKDIPFLRKRITWELLHSEFLTGAVVGNV